MDEMVKFGASTYELRSIIAHIGPSRHEGHYTAYSKCPDNRWSYFNDSKVLTNKGADLNTDEVQRNAYILLYQKCIGKDQIKVPHVELPKMSSPIGMQPFLISPMKNVPDNIKVSCQKLPVVDGSDEFEELADPLIWSSDEAETPLPMNSRRSLSSKSPLPLKINIKRMLRTSPKASSSQSSHKYEVVVKDPKFESREVRSPVKKLKISKLKRLSPKAKSDLSDHIYKVVRTPLKKITIKIRKRLSPKAYSTQSAHSYKIKCSNGRNGALPSPPQQTDIFDKSFGLFCDMVDNPEKYVDPNEKHDKSLLPPTDQQVPLIWNEELYEHEVKGGILPYKELIKNSNKDLQRWLQCRGQPYGVNRAGLLQLVQACIDEGSSHILDVKVDNGFPYRMKLQKLYPKQNAAENNLPDRGWGSFVSVSIPKLFNYGHIYNYLVESAPQLPVQEDGLSQEEFFDALESEDDDFNGDQSVKDPFEDSECPYLLDEKPLRRGMKFLKSGHVHSLSDLVVSNTYHVKASVAPSMPGPDKKVGVAISSISGSVQDAYCSCKASALGRCSHVSALLLYILRHVKLNGYDGTYMVGIWSGKSITVQEISSSQCFCMDSFQSVEWHLDPLTVSIDK